MAPISVGIKQFEPSGILRPANKNIKEDFLASEYAWLPDKNFGYVMVRVVERNEEKSIVQKSDNSQIEVQTNDLGKCNDSRFDLCEDIADMAELSEATLLHNLKLRYDSNFIYTFSGLFLVAINPYRSDLSLYTPEIANYYKNHSRNERPPHIFSIADEAYQALANGKNQSILITGESGAGKTENTKKVIQYLANTVNSVISSQPQANSLEQQIIEANPILEAFGNAQTVRNNNSSRFGKFVKIEFCNRQICGGNIEFYLLEKSRVTHRNAKERSFHIFYQLLASADQEMRDALNLTQDMGTEYFEYLKNGNCRVDGVDDAKEFQILSKSLDSLGFTGDERYEYFRIVAAILFLGNLKFTKTLNSAEQTSLVEDGTAENVCRCLGIDKESFVSGLLNPILVAGRDEHVKQDRNIDQVIFSVEALSRALYERMFKSLVERINLSIKGDRVRSHTNQWIGVLDIAGFEIFETNSFEQLLINLTNERLQQFFNHHMFISEQEEYKRECITWEHIDFGLDLQPTIDLIERNNPIGILACLDEDCVVPKATDKSFCEKVSLQWKDGKSAKFKANRFGDGFSIQHYAGTVQYCCEQWLLKNKDPLNEHLTKLIANKSGHEFVKNLFPDYFGSDDQIWEASKGSKRGLFRTVAQKHRESLHLLMKELYSTQPHFVRCIIPNEEKRAGVINAPLVLDQLKCNGVLEGIRICRLGYPSRVSYADFVRLYSILDNNLEGCVADSRSRTISILKSVGLMAEHHFMAGQTKIFLKNGQISFLDEKRDNKISTIIQYLQAKYRFKHTQRLFKRKEVEDERCELLQKNLKKYLELRQFPWWRLFCQVKPLLSVTRSDNRIKELENMLSNLTIDKEQLIKQLSSDLELERELFAQVDNKRREFERQCQQNQILLDEAVDSKAALLERKEAMEIEIEKAKSKLSDQEQKYKSKIEQLSLQISSLKEEQKQNLEQNRKQVSELKQKIDELEFEKIKLEKGEQSMKNRLAESESILETTKAQINDLDLKWRMAEEKAKGLLEKLEEESEVGEKLTLLKYEHDQTLKNLKMNFEQDEREREEEWESVKKRLQREIYQLTFDLEQEKRLSISLKENIRKYENGTDNLATKLEAEMKSQETWKKEKERIDARLKDVAKLYQEAMEREDQFQDQISSLYDQIREHRSRAGDLEEALHASERSRKAAIQRYESVNEQNKELTLAKQSIERSYKNLEVEHSKLMESLHGEQDQVVICEEKVKMNENMLKTLKIELESERKQNETIAYEYSLLEQQTKDLQLKLLEAETGTPTKSRKQSNPTYSTILSTIESESMQKNELLLEKRRLERQVKDQTAKLIENEYERTNLEARADNLEISTRKLQTLLEAAEHRSNEHELCKLRLEREVGELREINNHYRIEIDRFKSKNVLVKSASQILEDDSEKSSRSTDSFQNIH